MKVHVAVEESVMGKKDLTWTEVREEKVISRLPWKHLSREINAFGWKTEKAKHQTQRLWNYHTTVGNILPLPPRPRPRPLPLPRPRPLNPPRNGAPSLFTLDTSSWSSRHSRSYFWLCQSAGTQPLPLQQTQQHMCPHPPKKRKEMEPIYILITSLSWL